MIRDSSKKRNLQKKSIINKKSVIKSIKQLEKDHIKSNKDSKHTINTWFIVINIIQNPYRKYSWTPIIIPILITNFLSYEWLILINPKFTKTHHLSNNNKIITIYFNKKVIKLFNSNEVTIIIYSIIRHHYKFIIISNIIIYFNVILSA